MIIHSYYYGPSGNGGLDLQTTQELTTFINEDVIRELYTKDGHPNRIVQFSKVYNTLAGPVIGATRIEPAQSNDKRQTVINRTYFVRLADISDDLFRLMDTPTQLPLKQLQVTLNVNP